MIHKIYIAILLFMSVTNITAAVFNVKDYGAVNNKAVLSTAAIQKAIDACNAGGGGTVIVPAGEYLSSIIFMKSNVHLQFETGAVIYASRSVKDYEGLSMQHGATDAKTANILITAIDCHNIHISGKGKLIGQAERQEFTREAEYDANEPITGREIANADKYGADYRTKYRRVEPSPGLINITSCSDVTIEDIQLIESAFWTFHIQWSQRVFVKGVYIQSDSSNGVNSDGLDIDGCQSVVVSDCIIDTGDDALCIKTTNNGGKSMICEDIVVTNCILRSSSAALKIGTESHADFNRITVSNCIINGANRGLNIIIRDGATVSNVKFSNIIIKTERKRCFWWGNGDPIWFIVANRTPESRTGHIRNVTLDNITADSQSGIRLEGMSSAMENIRFTNVALRMEHENAIDKRSKHAFYFSNIKDLVLEGCSVEWDKTNAEPTWDKAFDFENIENLYLDRIKAPASRPGNKSINIKNLKGEFENKTNIKDI